MAASMGRSDRGPFTSSTRRRAAGYSGLVAFLLALIAIRGFFSIALFLVALVLVAAAISIGMHWFRARRQPARLEGPRGART
jgi:hypothetical protein